MPVKLSICIPTYNRAKFLPELLDSIISQANDEIEIVISDNASTDNTKEIVNEYKKKFNRITYFCWDKNMGADRNFLKVVELADGEYCWLMGSDDRIEAGAINNILDFLNKNITGISLNRYLYDFNFKKILQERPVGGRIISKDLVFNNLDEIISLFFDYFGYISGQVVNKKLWDEVISETGSKIEEYYNAYVHVYIISKMIIKKPFWGYISKQSVSCRSGNDSFLLELKSPYKRLELDIIGYEKILNDLFGKKSKLYKKLNKTIATVNVKSHLYNIKFFNPLSLVEFKIIRICFNYYKNIPFFWFFLLPLALTPTFILYFIRFIYRLTLKRFIKI
jgi:abequosyltransferase